jgi:arylsulfatase A-like enzyme
MRGLNAVAPDQPFFVYYVPGGSHSPHQPKKEWVDKFRGKFDMGWNELREQIFANQKRLGVIPANTHQWEPYLFKITPRSFRGWGSPATTSRPTWRTKRSSTWKTYPTPAGTANSPRNSTPTA